MEDSEERETAPSSIAADPASSHVADGLDGPVADNAQIDADWSSVAQDVNPLPTAATREDLSPVPLDSAISLTDAVDAGVELPLSSRETPVLPPKEAAADAGISAERPSEPAPLPVAAAAAAAVVAPVVAAPKLKTVPTLPPLPAQALAPKVPPPPPPTTRTPPPPPLASVSTPALPVVSRSTPAPATAAPPAPTAPASSSPELSFGEETKLKKKRKSKQWFEEIFDEDYLHTLPFMTPQQTEREVSYLLEALELPQGGRVLDVGCGYGRHAMELAARGYKAVGLDLSLPLLIRATDAARRVGVNVDFVHGDMREMTFENEFDGAYCMFTTFGFFDDDTNRKVAAGMCKALKPGGKLVLEMINRDYLIGDLPCRVWWQGDGCVLLEEVDFNYFTSRLQVQRQVILENGRQLKQDISIRLYSLHEMGKLLTHAGFKVIEVSGNLDLRGRFYGNESRQLIVVSEKRAEAAS